MWSFTTSFGSVAVRNESWGWVVFFGCDVLLGRTFSLEVVVVIEEESISCLVNRSRDVTSSNIMEGEDETATRNRSIHSFNSILEFVARIKERRVLCDNTRTWERPYVSIDSFSVSDVPVFECLVFGCVGYGLKWSETYTHDIHSRTRFRWSQCLYLQNATPTWSYVARTIVVSKAYVPIECSWLAWSHLDIVWTTIRDDDDGVPFSRFVCLLDNSLSNDGGYLVKYTFSKVISLSTVRNRKIIFLNFN